MTMEENRNLPQEKAKPAKKDKKPNLFVRFFRWIVRFFRELRSEMKKVTWMPASDVRKNTLLVVVSVIVVSLAVLGVDSLFNLIVQSLGAIY